MCLNSVFQPGEGPNWGLLRDCKTSQNLRECSFEALILIATVFAGFATLLPYWTATQWAAVMTYFEATNVPPQFDPFGSPLSGSVRKILTSQGYLLIYIKYKSIQEMSNIF